MKTVTKVVAVVATVAVLGTGVTSSVLAYKAFDKLDKYVKTQEEKDKEELEKTEDTENVLIADQYQIRSTKAISDAYISGESDDLSDEEKETLEVASDVLKDIITDGMSDYDKEKAIYEWIVDNIKHDGDGSLAVASQPDDVCYPLGVIKGKQAVCAGYATTFRLLTNMVGLDCMVMHEPELGHSWDICKLDDGCWYITDCYFDVGGTKFSGFNMTKNQASRNHSWEPNLYPEANGTKYCYAIVNATKIDKAEDIIEALKDPFNSDKNIYASIILPKGDEKEEATREYILSAIQDRGYAMEDNCSCEVNCFANGDDVVIEFTKSFYDDGNDIDPDIDLDYENLDKKITDAFGEYTGYDDGYDDGYVDYDEDGVDDGDVNSDAYVKTEDGEVTEVDGEKTIDQSVGDPEQEVETEITVNTVG